MVFGMIGIGASAFGIFAFSRHKKAVTAEQNNRPTLPRDLGIDGLPTVVTGPPYCGQRLATPEGVCMPLIISTVVYQDSEMSRVGACHISVEFYFGRGFTDACVVSDDRETISWDGYALAVDDLVAEMARPDESFPENFWVGKFSTFARLMPTKKTEKR